MFYSVSISGQCPQIFNEKLESSNCFAGTTICDLCVGDQLILSAEGLNLPNGGCVNWYFDTDPNFTPSPAGNSLGCSEIKADNPCNICLSIEYIMANPVGDDLENEFVVINSGGGFFTNDFFVDFNISNNGSGGVDSDIGTLECPLLLPNFSLLGCPDATPIGRNGFIPQNSIVVIFTDAGANSIYNFSYLCDSGAPIYYLQNSCNRESEAFSNINNGIFRTQGVSNQRCGCSSYLTYANDLRNEGDYINLEGETRNEIAFAPPVEWEQTDPIKNEIADFSFSISDDLCGGGPYYFKGIIDPFYIGCDEMITQSLEFQVHCPEANISGETEICNGEELILTASGGDDFIWENGEATSIIRDFPTKDTTYLVEASIGNCTAADEHEVKVFQNQTPQLGRDTICRSSVNYDLNNLLDDDFNTGNWIGVGVVGNDLIITDTGTVDLIFESDETCVENATTFLQIVEPISYFNQTVICDPVTETYVVEFEVSGGNTSTLSIEGSGNLSNNFFKSDPIPSGENFMFLIKDDGPCAAAIVEGTKTCDCEGGVPIAFFLSDVETCEGEEATLQIAFNGNPPFQFEILENGIPYLNEVSDFGVYDLIVKPNQNSTYTIQNFEDSNCPGTYVDNEAMVTVYPKIEFNFIDTIFYSNGTYSVVLSVSGSDNNFNFTGNSGRWDGAVFESDPTLCGTPIEVCAEGQNCETICYSNTFDCNSNCLNFAGSMSSDTAHFCALDTAFFVHDEQHIIKNDNNLIFVLHDRPGSDLGSILKIESQPEFIYTSDIRLGQVYYFSAVVGNSDGNGNVDFSDNCLSVAPGTPVIFHEFPDVELPIDFSTCRNELTSVNLNFIGNSPFNFSYQIDNFSFSNIISASTNYDLYSDFDKRRILTISKISDKYCSAESNKKIEIEVYDDLMIENLNYVCSPDNQMFIIDFDVSGGEVTSHQVIGNGNLIGPSFLSDPIQNGAQFQFEILDNLGCDTLILEGSFNCNCQTFAGTIEPISNDGNATKTLCGNETIYLKHNEDELLNYNERIEFVIHDKAGTTLGNVFEKNDDGVFSFTNNLTYNQIYYISVIAGDVNAQGEIDLNDPCLNVSFGLPIIFKSLPNASFTVGNEICEGDSTFLGFSFTGAPPFLVQYDIIENGIRTRDSATSTTNNFFNFYTPKIGSNEVSFELTEVESFGCSQAIAGFQTVNILPTPINRIKQSFCKNDSIIIENNIYNFKNPTDTIRLNGAAKSGCDSLLFINLIFENRDTIKIDSTLCEDDFLMVNGIRFDESNPNGFEIFETGSCDSLVLVQLDFKPNSIFNLFEKLCIGQSINIGNQTFDKDNSSGEVILVSQNGCDSLINVNLTFENMDTTYIESTICQDDFMIVNGKRFDEANPSGIEIIEMEYCDSLVSVQLNFEEISISSLTDTLCVGQSIVIANQQFNESNPFGEVILQSENGCDSIVDVQLFFETKSVFQLEIGNDTIIKIGETIDFEPVFSGILKNVKWTPANSLNCSDCLQTSARPLSNTTYQLLVVDEFGCEVTDSITVMVKGVEKEKVYIPTAFSPNNDGVNDFFCVFGGEEVSLIKRMLVFDRWGNSIFHGKNLIPNDLENGWNGQYKGRLMDSGVYLYYVEIEFTNGKVENFKGDITIK